jgi:hypothetical protein
LIFCAEKGKFQAVCEGFILRFIFGMADAGHIFYLIFNRFSGIFWANFKRFFNRKKSEKRDYRHETEKTWAKTGQKLEN